MPRVSSCWRILNVGDLYCGEAKRLDELISVFQFIGEDKINNSEMEVGKKSF